MKRRRVKLGLYGLTVAEIMPFCRGIIQKMTTNPNFTAAVNPHNVLLAEAVNELEAANLAAADGGKALKATLKLKKTNVFNVMRPYRDFVNEQGNGDEEILNTTGFPLAELPTPKGDLSIPGNLKAKIMDAPGKVEVVCDPVDGASGYQVRHRPVVSGNQVPPANSGGSVPAPISDSWITEDPMGPSRQVIVGLQSAVYHEFQMRAIGSGKPSPWSGSINSVAK
ncbi:MAG: hypothetical protein KBF73_10410 [Flavobacteriales bacterium]|nr:hypothetical protein [Flavobacteriales bacterium]